MFTYAKISEVGERKINEDSVGSACVGPDIGLFILADGLGGHGRGEEASELITQKSKEVFRYYYNDPQCLARCFETSQRALMEKQNRENAKQDLKSTLVLLKLVNGTLQWGHVGDSRLYYFKRGVLQARTLDHSVPQMLVAAGEIQEKEIRHHPDRNRLLRVMGMEWESPKYQISEMIPAQGDEAFLMCSDGFWENIEEEDMESCLKKSSDIYDWLRRMEKIVLKNGRGTNMDNYSAVGVWIK